MAVDDNLPKDPAVQTPSQKEAELEKDLFVWKAASRPFKRRSRDFWIKLIAIASIFGLVFFLVEGIMPVILMIALIFLFYVLSTVEPENIEYKITTKGLNIAGKITTWDVFNRYWFTSRLGSSLMILETKVLPGRIELIIDSKDTLKLKEIMTKYLPEEKNVASGVEKASDWLSRKLSAS